VGEEMRATSAGPDLSRAIVRIENKAAPPVRLLALALLALLMTYRSQR
jgi:hypothetical protein